MQQLSLFDPDGISCIHCGEFLKTTADLQQQCPISRGKHEIRSAEFFVLYRKTYGVIQ